MSKRVCEWQHMMLETGLNIHVSRCENKGCESFLSPVHRELCESCQHRLPTKDRDEVIESMAEDIHIEGGRQDAEAQHFFETHCKKCEQYDAVEGYCLKIKCDFAAPIRDLMVNPGTHCPLELW